MNPVTPDRKPGAIVRLPGFLRRMPTAALPLHLSDVLEPALTLALAPHGIAPGVGQIDARGPQGARARRHCTLEARQ